MVGCYSCNDASKAWRWREVEVFYLDLGVGGSDKNYYRSWLALELPLFFFLLYFGVPAGRGTDGRAGRRAEDCKFVLSHQ